MEVDVKTPLIGEHATVADAFEAAAGQFPDRIAYVAGDSGERWTFAQWFARSDALARTLVGDGVDPGDVVVLMLPSGFDYAVAYGAAMLAGAVATGINARLGPREIAAIIDRANPAAILFDPSAFDPAISEVVAAANVPVVRPEELSVGQLGPGLGADRPCRRADDPAVVIWTSGTTGTPKGAWFDHGGLRAAVASAGVMSAPFDIKLVATPFPHAGFMAKLWDQLAWVTTAVIAPTPWRADDMLRLLVEEQITVAAGVPTQWAKLLEQPAIVGADLTHVRVGLVATAPAPPELVERVSAAIGCPLVVRYAMTESPSITGTEPDDPPEVQFRTVGRPQAGMEVEVVDDRGRPVPADVVGRVRVRGGCVMRGYWADPELTAAVLDGDGWLISTDLGKIGPDGNLVLAGRLGDMYIRGGYNVYPLEVEHVLAEHPSVERAAVVGVAAPVIGEIGVAYITLVPGAVAPTLDDLRTWVSARLADYKAPDRLEVIDEMPLTSMMKIDTAALRRQAELISSAERHSHSARNRLEMPVSSALANGRARRSARPHTKDEH